MILRRLVIALRRQDFVTVTIETLIVVLGVYLGIQLGNWNEAQREDARRDRVTAHLITDLTEIERRAGVTAEIYDGRVQSALRLTAFLRSGQAAPDDLALFEDDVDRVLSTSTAIPRSPTVIELLASGDTGLIDNEGLRFDIVRFDRSMQSATDANVGIIDLWARYTEPVSLHAYPVFGPTPDGQSYEAVEIVHDIEALRADPRVLPALSWLASVNRAELELRRAIGADAAALRARLEPAR